MPSGVGVSSGVGLGPAKRMADPVREPAAGLRHGGDAGAETARLREATERVAIDLAGRAARAREAGREEAADILDAQSMMAADPALAQSCAERIQTGATAEGAAWDAFGGYRELLAAAGGYMAERVSDLDDIRDRVVAVLTGVDLPGLPESDEPYVLLARDLAPADTAGIDPDLVAAIVTEQGGPTSHTAILARTMGIPAVVACPAAADIQPDVTLLVDGARGEITIAPSEAAIARAEETARRRTAAQRATGPGRTADGHPVALLANIGGPADVQAAKANGAEGVGLFRTEFLFLDRDQAPGFDEQTAAYRKVLAAFPGAKVVVRTLDAGADKPLAFLNTAGEPNPALGVRALRLSFADRALLDEQLRALAAAAADTEADLQVMAPMVADRADAEFFTAAARDAGIATAGVMVEIPAAALRAGQIAGSVDFFSIGTNDLAQYAFAADRQVGELARYQDPWQPALLDLVAATAEAAAAAGKPCGVCGEAAADPALACVLTGLGATSLSMSAPALAGVRAALTAHSLDQCREAAEAARAAAGAEEARAAARSVLTGLAEFGL